MINQLYLPSQPCQRLQRILISQLFSLLRTYQHKVVFQQLRPFLHPIFLRSFRIGAGKFDYQGLLHPKYSVRSLVRIVADI